MTAREILDEKILNAFGAGFTDAFLKLEDEEVDRLYNHLKQYKHQQMKNRK